MAGVAAQGATFSFGSSSAFITSISVESPTAEVVDMTSTSSTSASQVVLVPTGAWSGGSVEVGFLHGGGTGFGMASNVRSIDTLTLTSPGFSVTRRAILESASISAATGDIVKGNLKFRLTDHTATTAYTW